MSYGDVSYGEGPYAVGTVTDIEVPEIEYEVWPICLDLATLDSGATALLGRGVETTQALPDTAHLTLVRDGIAAELALLDTTTVIEMVDAITTRKAAP